MSETSQDPCSHYFAPFYTGRITCDLTRTQSRATSFQLCAADIIPQDESAKSANPRKNNFCDFLIPVCGAIKVRLTLNGCLDAELQFCAIMSSTRRQACQQATSTSHQPRKYFPLRLQRIPTVSTKTSL
jgi:hypothetical protein